jgi:ABC-type polysaccharide/polyol phosphate export permease
MNSLILLFSIKNFLIRIWQNRQTLWLMIERDFKNRYVGSFAGMLWSVIHPLMLVFVYTLIFSLIFGRNIGKTPFALWLFCALLPWIMFAEIVRGSAGVLEKNRSLITKTPFHSEILPLVVIGAAVTGHLIGFGVLIALLLLCKQSIGLWAFSIPFYLLCLIFFSLGLSWLVAALNVFIKDVVQIVNVIIQFWFYLCPIIYPVRIIPEQYHFLLRLNPMYFITEGYRRALLNNQGFPLIDFLCFSSITLFLLFIGAWTFRRLKGQFAEVL